METTKLLSRGRVLLPKGIRDSKGWNRGTEFTVEETPQGILLRPRDSVDQVAGCLGYTGKSKTLAEMKQAIAVQVRRRHELGRYQPRIRRGISGSF